MIGRTAITRIACASLGVIVGAGLGFAVLLPGCRNQRDAEDEPIIDRASRQADASHEENDMNQDTTSVHRDDGPMPTTDEGWREKLTPEQYRVLRQAGTERAFSGEYVNTTTEGIYKCAGCGEVLFESQTKFDSGCGWPSFFQPASEEAVSEHIDRSLGLIRIEVTCRKCGGHLGHVFRDGPRETTGLRYCINSAALDLEPTDTNGDGQIEADGTSGITRPQ